MQFRTQFWFSALSMGLAAGIASWGLGELGDRSLADKAWMYSGICLVSCALLLFLLMRNSSHRSRTACYVIVPSCVISLCTLWVLKLESSGDHFLAFVLTIIIALYCALPFLQIQHENGGFRFPYPLLFQHSWNNGFIILIAMTFCGLFWLLLLLWGGLFALIDISFFRVLFGKSYFHLPASYAITSDGPVLRRAVQAFLVSLPVYCAIALYAIGLRIAQHGLMPRRFSFRP